jgi:cytochrome c biogenesis protein CcmG/thiol:disulfide interchange protein DsbE
LKITRNKKREKLAGWMRFVLAALAVGGFVGILTYAFTRDERYMRTLVPAERAPSFILTLFDGKVIKLEDFRGRTVFVNFWASWCVPCRAEASALESAWRKHKDKGVVFLGVNIQDKEEDARAFIKEFGITYLNGPDPNEKIAVDYAVWGIPQTFLIDPQGGIAYRHAGELKAPIIETKLNEVLQGMVNAEGKGDYRSVR